MFLTGRVVKKFSRNKPIMVGLGLTVIFIIGSSLVGSYYERHEPQPSAESASRQSAGADAYKNLDLSIARQATYTNRPLRVIKDLGIKDKVRFQVVNFDVPKDGLSEYGLMSNPPGKAPKGGFPVLILCHGYSRPGYYSTTKAYLPDMEFYSQHGFSVIKPDFRGQGMSIHQGSPDGAFYSMSYNTDVLSLVAAIKQTDFLNRNDISIWGHSMGGYIALRAAVLSPDIKRVILLAAPVGTAEDLFRLYTPISDTDNIVARRIRADELAKYGTPLSNPSYWNAASPLSYLSDLRGYVQIYVGRNDHIVPPRFSADLDKALTKAQKIHEYYLYNRGTHGLVQQRPLIWSTSLKQLQKVKAEP